MKIVKIEAYQNSMCDNMLSNGYYSDTIFEKCFIDVTININDNVLAPLYRKLWEDVYIKIPTSITHFNDKNELVVGITVSEALSFIYKATPPNMQYQVKDANKSINDIVENLKAFLLNDNSYVITSMFAEHIHIGPINSQWQNFERIKAGSDLITSKLTNGYGVYIYASTNSLNDLIDCNFEGVSTTLMCVKLNTTQSSNIKSFCDKILFDESFDVKVDNIYVENHDVYVGIYMNIDPAKGKGMPEPCHQLIKRSYENLQ